MKSDKFPAFWYESNACWGSVTNMQELAAMAVAQLEENNGINTVAQFLLHSYQDEKKSSFGTRREHTSKYCLFDFLSEYHKSSFIEELGQAIADLKKDNP